MSKAEFELGRHEVEGGGLKIYTSLPGFGGSSTRAELGAGILAIAADGAVHIGTDSRAFKDKAEGVINLVALGKKPKKPYASQKDGDLWQIFANYVAAKGPTAIRISKVKGHATEADIEEGKVIRQHREGNDKADLAAKKGIQKHGEDFVKLAGWFATRHQRYISPIMDIHSHLIEGSVIRKQILKERETYGKRGNNHASPGGGPLKAIRVTET